jgi:chemotaxis protein MotB
MIRQILLAAILVPIFIGCVTKKKYDDLLAQKIKMEADLADRNALIDKNTSDIQLFESQLAKLKADTTSLGIDLRNNTSKLSSLEKEHAQLSTYYKNLLNNSGKLNRDVAQQQEQLSAIQKRLDATRKTNDSLSNSLAEREKKVHELEQVMASKDKAVQDLKNRISGALLNFKENDISVQVKNGKVYVSLAEQLLFKSGSVDVDSKGVAALQQLAKAIKDQKDLNILVEGHTDNVPISKKSAYMSDNWDLSVMRATAITRILTKGGVGPGQITASGRGEYSPLAQNDSPQNKQKNRRTEIIITPNLDELFKILESN